MRIISGSLKGKKIAFLKSDKTRPLKDSVKENIFNIILHSNIIKIDIKNSIVLDLYSGIGSFGLECISRGAKNVTFVEKSKFALEILLKNIKEFNIENKTYLFSGDIKDFIDKTNQINYQIFFLDPPFKDNNFLENLKLIKKKKLFRKKHLIIVHREKNCKDEFVNIMKPFLIKSYGRSKIIFGEF